MENKPKRGGRRPGAGRPKNADGQRQPHQLRAFPDEWELINQFAKIVKHGDKNACINFLAQMNRPI